MQQLSPAQCAAKAQQQPATSCMPARLPQEEVLHGLPAPGQHIQGRLHSVAAQGPGGPVWLQLQGSPQAWSLGAVPPLQAQAQACFRCRDLTAPACHAAHRPRPWLDAAPAGTGTGMPARHTRSWQ